MRLGFAFFQVCIISLCLHPCADWHAILHVGSIKDMLITCVIVHCSIRFINLSISIIIVISFNDQSYEIKIKICSTIRKTKFTLCWFGWKAIDVRSWTKEMKTWIWLLRIFMNRCLVVTFCHTIMTKSMEPRYTTESRPICQNTVTSTGKVSILAAKKITWARNISVLLEPISVLT